MALPLSITCKCTSIGAAVTDATLPSYNGGTEMILLEPTGANVSVVNAASISIAINDGTKQGLFTVGTSYTVAIS